MIAVYVTGHGFGHATRTAETLRVLRTLAPELAIAVTTTAPEFLFRHAVSGRLLYRPLSCDVGVSQKGALEIDGADTIARWRALRADEPARIASEAAWMRSAGVRLVLADIPPFAFRAAAAAGIPAWGIGNFSWDWIWRYLAGTFPELHEAADDATEAYGLTELLLQLPFTGDMTAFPRRREIPMVARAPRLPRDEVRRTLGLAPKEKAVLLSFGGIGLPGFDFGVLRELRDYVFLVHEAAAIPSNVRRLPWLEARGLHFHDVVGAVDVVVTKPGYGIVTDCIAARTRIVYTDRGDFPEYPILVAGMEQLAPCAYVSNEDLLAGRLAPVLAAAEAQPWPAPPPMDGAQVIAEAVLQAI